MKNLTLKINWMSIVLLLSLILNFFVIGYLYAQYKSKQIRMTRLSFDHSISKLVEPFPRSAKHDFYGTMKGKRDQLIPIYQDIKSQRAAIMAIIAEDTVDVEKLKQSLNDYHDTYHGLVELSQDEIIRIIGELSAEERAKILEQYNNPPKRKYRSKSRDDDRRRSSHSNDHKNDDDKRDNNSDWDW